MIAETLNCIYHDPKDPGLLNNVERLVRHARQLHISGVTRQRSRNTYTASKTTRCTSRPTVGSPETTPMWRKSMLSGRPTWPICRVSPSNTADRGTFSPCVMHSQVRLGTFDPLQGRQGNHNGFRAAAHHCEPTLSTAPTDRKGQGILQLRLQYPEEMQRYPALC